jgi:hypothetical protein
MTKLTQVLQPIADQFEKLGTPEPIVAFLLTQKLLQKVKLTIAS